MVTISTSQTRRMQFLYLLRYEAAIWCECLCRDPIETHEYSHWIGVLVLSPGWSVFFFEELRSWNFFCSLALGSYIHKKILVLIGSPLGFFVFITQLFEEVGRWNFLCKLAFGSYVEGTTNNIDLDQYLSCPQNTYFRNVNSYHAQIRHVAWHLDQNIWETTNFQVGVLVLALEWSLKSEYRGSYKLAY